MDNRDDWPDGILEGDLDSVDGLDAEARRSAERIARDARNMNAVLGAMADKLSESLPAPEFGRAARPDRRSAWRNRALAPLAAAAAVAALILLLGDRTGQSSGPESSAGVPGRPSMMAEMEVEADRPFVVFPTTDPDIAVVWLFNSEESD